MSENNEASGTGFWARLPVAVQALVALAGAAAALITALSAAGFFDSEASSEEGDRQQGVATANVEAKPEKSSEESSQLDENPPIIDRSDDRAPSERAEAPKSASATAPVNALEKAETVRSEPPEPAYNVPLISPQFPNRAVLRSRLKGVAVFESADLLSAEVGTAERGQTFVVGELKDGWRPIKVSDSVQGWIKDEHLSLVIADD